MATDIATLGIKIEASDIKAAVAELDRLESQAKKTGKASSKLFKKWKRDVAVAGAATAFLTKQVLDQVNAYQGLTNKLRLVTKGSDDLLKTQEALFMVAQDSRGALEATTDLYFRFAKTTDKLGLSQQELLDITESTNQAVALSGTTSEGASAALFQMGQGLAANALRGQELNSVMEQTPRLAQAIADGMGIELGALRKVAEQGKLTSEVVVKALKSQSSVLAAEFGQTEKTIDQALTQIKNTFLKTFGEIDAKEFVGALDEFREIISDPAVVEGLQNVGVGLVKLATFTTEAAAGFGTLGKAIGFFAAKATGQLNGTADKLIDIQNEIKELEFYQKQAAIGSGLWNNTTDKLTLAYKAATKLRKELVDIQLGGPKTGGKKTGPKTGDGDTPEPAINDKATEKYFEKLLKQYDALRESLLSREQLIQIHSDKELENLKILLDNKKISQEEYNQAVMDSEINTALERIELEKQVQDEKEKMQRAAIGVTSGIFKNLSVLMSSESKKEFEIGKTAAIAGALVDGAAAAVASFKAGADVGGPVLGSIYAGTSLLATGFQINQIRSQQFGRGGSLSNSGGGGGAPAAGGGPAPAPAAASTGGGGDAGPSINITVEGNLLGNSDFIEAVAVAVAEAARLDL